MKRSDNHRSAAQWREDFLGMVLSRTLQGQGDPRHLTAQEIAELVEGVVASEEKERFLGHLAGCTECRESYLLTCRLVEEQSLAGRVKPRFFRYALAATVLLTIVAWIFLSRDELPPEQMVLTPPVAPRVEPATPQAPPVIVAKRPPEPVPPRQAPPAPFFTAQLDLEPEQGRILARHQGVTDDANTIDTLLAELEGELPALGNSDIREVRVILVAANSVTKALTPAVPARAALVLKDEVLTIRLSE